MTFCFESKLKQEMKQLFVRFYFFVQQENKKVEIYLCMFLLFSAFFPIGRMQIV
jgi:hypothetical protein